MDYRRRNELYGDGETSNEEDVVDVNNHDSSTRILRKIQSRRVARTSSSKNGRKNALDRRNSKAKRKSDGPRRSSLKKSSRHHRNHSVVFEDDLQPLRDPSARRSSRSKKRRTLDERYLNPTGYSGDLSRIDESLSKPGLSSTSLRTPQHPYRSNSSTSYSLGGTPAVHQQNRRRSMATPTPSRRIDIANEDSKNYGFFVPVPGHVYEQFYTNTPRMRSIPDSPSYQKDVRDYGYNDESCLDGERVRNRQTKYYLPKRLEFETTARKPAKPSKISLDSSKASRRSNSRSLKRTAPHRSSQLSSKKGLSHRHLSSSKSSKSTPGRSSFQSRTPQGIPNNNKRTPNAVERLVASNSPLNWSVATEDVPGYRKTPNTAETRTALKKVIASGSPLSWTVPAEDEDWGYVYDPNAPNTVKSMEMKENRGETPSKFYEWDNNGIEFAPPSFSTPNYGRHNAVLPTHGLQNPPTPFSTPNQAPRNHPRFM